MPAKPLNQLSGMPQMRAAFAGWTTTITLQKITQTIVDGVNTDTASAVTFEGVIQPLSPNKLYLKPEGLRNFGWIQIHCVNGRLTLAENDRILYNGKRYKVDATNDWSLNGFIEYQCIEDYQGQLNG